MKRTKNFIHYYHFDQEEEEDDEDEDEEEDDDDDEEPSNTVTNSCSDNVVPGPDSARTVTDLYENTHDTNPRSSHFSYS